LSKGELFIKDVRCQGGGMRFAQLQSFGGQEGSSDVDSKLFVAK